MSHIVARAQNWLSYLVHAKTKFRIHSPFVYNLIVKVLEDQSFYPAYKEVENRAEILKHDRRSILRPVLGARHSKTLTHNKISAIARKECIRRRYGRLLYRMVHEFKPANILELGTSLGISTAYMSLAYPGSRIFTMEGCDELSMIAEKTFKFLNAGQVEVIKGDFDQVMPGALQRIESLDMVFIDGNHKKEPVLNYFNQILAKVHNDSILILDDIHWSKEMQSAWLEICNHEKVKVTMDLFQIGLVFFKKELSKENFVILYS